MGEQVSTDLRSQSNVLELAFVNSDWVHRRVESLRMVDAGITTVRVSLDISTDLYAMPVGPTGGIVIPLAVATKGPIRRLDVSSEGLRVAVLNTAQNATMVAKALVLLARGVVTDAEAFEHGLINLGKARPAEAAQLHDKLIDLLQMTNDDESQTYELVRLLMEQLVDGYLLLVELHGQVAERLTVKYSYEAGPGAVIEDVHSGWLIWPLGTYAMACSSHFEVEVPFPLVLEGSTLFEEVPGGAGSLIRVVEEESASQLHHLVAVPTQPLVGGTWLSEVSVAESTVTRAALSATTSTAVLCAYLLVGTWGMGLTGHSGLNLEPSTSLLLAVAGLVWPLVGRAPRHWLLAKAVQPFRDLTTWAGVVLFATALIIGTVPDEPTRVIAQFVLLGCALGLTIRMLYLRRRVSIARTIVVKGGG